jgi:pilus assembly protein Flp/PilA
MLKLQLLSLRLLKSADSEDERGATLVEYALLVALIAIVCIGAVTLLGSSVSGQFSSITEPLN